MNRTEENTFVNRKALTSAIYKKKRCEPGSSALPTPLHTVVLLLMVTLCAGCAQVRYQYYQGSPKPHEQLAILHTAMEDPVCIRSIDGRSFSYLKTLVRLNIDSPFVIELLPGHHDLVVYFAASPGIDTHLISRADLALSLELKPGHDYHFVAEITETDLAGRTQRVWRPTIVDEGQRTQK